MLAQKLTFLMETMSQTDKLNDTRPEDSRTDITNMENMSVGTMDMGNTDSTDHDTNQHAHREWTRAPPSGALYAHGK